MKKSSLLFKVGQFLIILLVVAFPAQVKAEKIEFQCTETSVAILNPGSWTYPDGNIHVRGMVSLLRETAPDPRSVGNNTVVVNANWQADGTGPMWGSWHLHTDEGGVWEGTWAGQVTPQGSWYNAVGDGYGMYAGMKMWVDMDFGDCHMTILEH